MGPNREYGQLVIRRSTDAGKTWTEPKDARSGLLLADGKYHTSTCPVVVHNGRIWRAVEDAMGPGGWGSHFRAFVMSAPEDADLLDAASWTRTNSLGRNPAWLNKNFGGWLEGNAVVTPDGGIADVLRVENRPKGETAAIIQISPDSKTATFDPGDGFVHFPGGNTKFTIRWDPESRLYWTLSNYVPPRHAGPNAGMTRNTLALCSSPDLRNWEVRSIVLYHPDREKHGFQYVDWVFDGAGIIAVSRTAFDDEEGGAHNQHDANYLTFHRISGFRTLTMKDSVARP
ncbi:MAG TPA: sialidase family protein [Tepidisphaeraceae bacterium]|nr:sialidase family protein [Tepidisphaeraceae bacterium]